MRGWVGVENGFNKKMAECFGGFGLQEFFTRYRSAQWLNVLMVIGLRLDRPIRFLVDRRFECYY